MGGAQLILLIILVCVGCSTPNLPISVVHERYRVEHQVISDSSMIQLIRPYRESVDKYMQTIIGFATHSLYKKKPESVLGNLLADCVQEMGGKGYGKQVDLGLIDDEIVRGYIHKGNITMANIFQLLPSNNQLVFHVMSGESLQQLIQHTAKQGGWSVSAGSSYRISNHQAVDIMINGKPLNVGWNYTIATTDNRGKTEDFASLMGGGLILQKSVVLRELFIEYITNITAKGRPVIGKIEDRVKPWNE